MGNIDGKKIGMAVLLGAGVVFFTPIIANVLTFLPDFTVPLLDMKLEIVLGAGLSAIGMDLLIEKVV